MTYRRYSFQDSQASCVRYTAHAFLNPSWVILPGVGATCPLRAKQLEALVHLRAGTSLIVSLPVAYGKTVIYEARFDPSRQLHPTAQRARRAHPLLVPDDAFGCCTQLHLLTKRGVIVVIEPTNVLVEAVKQRCFDLGIGCHHISGTLNNKALDKLFNNAVDGTLKLCVGTHAGGSSHSLVQLMGRLHAADLLTCIVYDEAHKLDEWQYISKHSSGPVNTLPRLFPDAVFMYMTGSLQPHLSKLWSKQLIGNSSAMTSTTRCAPWLRYLPRLTSAKKCSSCGALCPRTRASSIA